MVAEHDSRYYARRFALSRAFALAGITLTLGIPLTFYARSTAPAADSFPLVSPDGRAYYLAALILVAVIAVLIRALETDDPARIVNSYGERLYRYRQPAPRTAWMMPAVGLFSLYTLMAVHDRLILQLAIPFVAGGLVLASRVLRYEVLSTPGDTSAMAASVYQVLVILVAGLAFFTIFGFRARGLHAMPVLFATSGLLMMTAFDGLEITTFRRAIYALIGGAAVAELYWALTFWNISNLAGAGLLLTAFAFFGGMAKFQLDGGVRKPQVIVGAMLASVVFVVLTRLGG